MYACSTTITLLFIQQLAELYNKSRASVHFKRPRGEFPWNLGNCSGKIQGFFSYNNGNPVGGGGGSYLFLFLFIYCIYLGVYLFRGFIYLGGYTNVLFLDHYYYYHPHHQQYFYSSTYACICVVLHLTGVRLWWCVVRTL